VLVDWLIKRAKRTPYFDLPGYMERFWLVPYRDNVERTVNYPVGLGDSAGVRLSVRTTDGTGPVRGFRPIARLLQRFDIAVRVHHILRSDEGRDPHDHPWDFCTIVLRGGYVEDCFDANGDFVGADWHGPGSILFRRAHDLHMLWLPPGHTAWTLFITGRKRQKWGFKPRSMPKIPHDQYQT